MPVSEQFNGKYLCPFCGKERPTVFALEQHKKKHLKILPKTKSAADEFANKEDSKFVRANSLVKNTTMNKMWLKSKHNPIYVSNKT